MCHAPSPPGVCQRCRHPRRLNGVTLCGAGTHAVDAKYDIFNLSGVAAPVSGRLTIAGAGMYLTTLNITTHASSLSSSVISAAHKGGAARITVRDLTFARWPAPTTTQAHIVGADEHGVTLEQPPGVPSLDTLFEHQRDSEQNHFDGERGLFMRRYQRVATDRGRKTELHVIVAPKCAKPNSCNVWPPEVNDQIHFYCAGAPPDFAATSTVPGTSSPSLSGNSFGCPNITKLPNRRWRLIVTSGKMSPWAKGGEMKRYQDGAGDRSIIVAIKVKHGAQAFKFSECDDVTFERLRWLGHSRGIFQSCRNVVLRHTRVDLSPSSYRRNGEEQWLPLASNGGGPQANHCTNLTILNHTSENTGDDAVGLFHINGGSVKGCTIRDSFCTGIKLCDTNLVVEGNVLTRCPLSIALNNTPQCMA